MFETNRKRWSEKKREGFVANHFFANLNASSRRSAVALCPSRCRKSLCILDIIRRRDFLPNLHVHFCIRRFLPRPRRRRRRVMSPIAILGGVNSSDYSYHNRWRTSYPRSLNIAPSRDTMTPRASFPSNFRDTRGVNPLARTNYDKTMRAFQVRATLERRPCAARPRIV